MDSETHGEKHSENVAKIGKYICERNGADYRVVEYFSAVHDSCRQNDYEDPEHGKRAAEKVKNITGLDEKQKEQLSFACEHHPEENAKSDDITIQTCWDADRLDLFRVGITPVSELLFTEVAKTQEAFNYAQSLSDMRQLRN